MATESLAAALADLQTQLPRITKDLTAKVKSERTGAQYQYSYADLAQISRELLPLLGKLGLSFTARPTLAEGRFVLAYKLLHISGDKEEGQYPLPDRGTPQEIGGAITYARRYCLCAVTGVAPDSDDDDAKMAESAARRRRTERPTRQTRDAEPPVEQTASGEQMRRMGALFKQLGVNDRDAKLAYAVEVIGRPLASSTDLTGDEIGQVITKLQKWADQDEPPADAA